MPAAPDCVGVELASVKFDVSYACRTLEGVITFAATLNDLFLLRLGSQS